MTGLAGIPQSLVAPMIRHFLQDIGIVLIPLFGIKVT